MSKEKNISEFIRENCVKSKFNFTKEKINNQYFEEDVWGLFFLEGHVSDSEFNYLVNSSFCKTVFENCNFKNMGASFCDFDGCKFINCDFQSSNIYHCSFEEAIFESCNFEEASFYDTRLYDASFEKCLFDEVMFSNSNLFYSYVKNPVSIAWNSHEFIAKMIYDKAEGYEERALAGFILANKAFCWSDLNNGSLPSMFNNQYRWALNIIFQLAVQSPGQYEPPFNLIEFLQKENFDVDQIKSYDQ